MLPADVAARLLGEIWAQYPSDRTGITFANVDCDRGFMAMVAEIAAPIWQEHLLPLFPRHRVAFTTVVVKHPGEDSLMSAHEDGTFVEPSEGRSATVWIPLIRCTPDEDNGPIAVLPGSHLMVSTRAGANVAEWFVPYRRYLTQRLTTVPAEAGEAVVWDSRLVHGSAPNRSSGPRVVVAAELVPRSCDLIHVEAVGRSARRLYVVDEAFHLDHSPSAVRHLMPPYPVARRFQEPIQRVSPDQVAALCGTSEAPVDETDRPVDDWCTDPCPGGVPQVVPDDEEPLRLGVDAWCEALVDDIRSLPGALADAGRGSLVAERSAGHHGCIELVGEHGANPLAAAALPRTVALLASEPDVAGALVLALAPGASVALPRADERIELYVPLVMPAGSGGVATSSAVARFEFAQPVQLDASCPRQVFNDGGEELRLLVLTFDCGA